MEYNGIQEAPNPAPIFLPVDIKEKNQKCLNCEKELLNCDFNFPCSNCISLGKSNVCTKKQETPKSTVKSPSSTSKGTKRGYKSHVPSACVNCKTAHLACDISRPCKRCVALNKTDTCHDMQHKKRGRPKLREKRIQSSTDNSYEILYGTIQTPTITLKSATRNIIPAQQDYPSKLKSNNHSSVISFIHEPIESFQQPSLPDNSIFNVDTILPSVQLSSNPFIIDNKPPPISNSPPPPPPPPSFSENPTITIILSMEVCCAKVSDEIIKCWGYYPQELAHRSFYDFISPKDSDRLARLHRLLIDNTLNISNNHNNHAPLPPTERTTSSLFSDTEHKTLCIKANGSRSFSDTIHIKKRSGKYELYETVVYIGGGLGANLYNPSTLSNLYIVAQFKRHEYEVAEQQGILENPSVTFEKEHIPISEEFYNIQPIAAFSPLSPLTPTSPSNNSVVNFNNQNNQNIDIFKKDFPSYERVEKRLSIQKNNPLARITSSNPPTSILPKFNIAPVTSKSSYPPPRFLPSIPPSATPAAVTHPTQQYFLQTSSSTLNAAASAVQSKSRQTPNSAMNSSSTTNTTPDVSSSKKMEMSIRSLLC